MHEEKVAQREETDSTQYTSGGSPPRDNYRWLPKSSQPTGWSFTFKSAEKIQLTNTSFCKGEHRREVAGNWRHARN